MVRNKKMNETLTDSNFTEKVRRVSTISLDSIFTSNNDYYDDIDYEMLNDLCNDSKSDDPHLETCCKKQIKEVNRKPKVTMKRRQEKESSDEIDRLEYIEREIKKRKLEKINDNDSINYFDSEKKSSYISLPKNHYENREEEMVDCYTSSQHSTIPDCVRCSLIDHVSSNTLCQDVAIYCQLYYEDHLNVKEKVKPLSSNLRRVHQNQRRLDRQEFSNSNSFMLSSILSIEDAISFIPKPRVVVEAKYPFMIVHANSSYEHLTGESNYNLIGKELPEVLAIRCNTMNGKENLLPLLETCAHLSELGNNVTADLFSSRSMKTIKCSLTVYPVIPRNKVMGNDEKDTKNKCKSYISHYVLDMISSSENECKIPKPEIVPEKVVLSTASIIEDRSTKVIEHQEKQKNEKQELMNLRRNKAIKSSSYMKNYIDAALCCESYYLDLHRIGTKNTNNKDIPIVAPCNLHHTGTKNTNNNNENIPIVAPCNRMKQTKNSHFSDCFFLPRSSSSKISLDQAISFYPNPRMIIDAETLNIVHINSAYSRLTGYPSNEIVGDSVLLFIDEMKLTSLLQKSNNAISSSSSDYVELKIFCLDDCVHLKQREKQKKSLHCNLTVYPVVSSSNEKKNTEKEISCKNIDKSSTNQELQFISHYVLDITHN